MGKRPVIDPKRVFPFGEGEGKAKRFRGKKAYTAYRAEHQLHADQWHEARLRLAPRRRAAQMLVDETKRLPSNSSFSVRIRNTEVNCTVARGDKYITVTVQHPRNIEAKANFTINIEKLLKNGLLGAVEKRSLGPRFEESFGPYSSSILLYIWKKAA